MGKVSSNKSKMFSLLERKGVVINNENGSDYYIEMFCDMCNIQKPINYKKTSTNEWFCRINIDGDSVSLDAYTTREKIRHRKILKKSKTKTTKWKSLSHNNDTRYNIKNFFGVGGIYFLYYKNEIVYIGQSSCVFSRISTHYSENKKIFDNFSIHKIAGGKKARENVEAEHIEYHKPFYNIQHNNK